MGLPWREFSVASGVAAYFLTWRNETSTKWSVISTFCLSWTVLFLGWAIWSVILYPKFFSPLRDLPEPKNPSFWNGQYSRIAKETSGAPAREWINTIPNNGLIRYLGLLNQERLFITSAKALAEVLVTKNYEWQKPPQMRFFLARVLGEGILLAEGDEHKFQRRNLMPAFSFRHVKDLYPIFWSKAMESVRVMTEQVRLDAAKQPQEKGAETDGAGNSAVLEINSWASRLTLDIIGLAGLGRDFGSLQDPNNELNRLYSTLFKPNKQAQLLGLAAVFLPQWVVANIPLKRNHDIYAARSYIREVCHSLIREKKERLARKELTDVDILSVALESGQFADDNLVDQLMTFLAAGHETTAAAMTWAVYMLCIHEDVQARLREEVRSRLPAGGEEGVGSSISSLDIDHMPYLNAVCNEVLRCWCPVPMTLREAAHDTSVQGHFVPRGTRVMIYPWALNYSTDLWGPDALRFDPQRWMPKEGSTDTSSSASGGAASNYAFMTFLHGPRSCIGSGFARAEFACLLAAWVGRFAFALHDEEMRDEAKIEIKGGATARPAKGMPVRVTVLDGW